MGAVVRAVLFLISAAFCSALQRQSLGGQWMLNGGPLGAAIDATVPGGVFSNLMDRDVLDNIFFGSGDSDSAWVGETDWTYTRTFTVDEELLAHRVVSLVFEGLDTFATILINGNEIGVTENMFVRYSFNVKDQLQVGDNEISVKFTSAVNKAAALAEDPSNAYVVPPECPDPAYHGICHANRIRKMPASFSWDWGPAFASAGIWKDVYLQAFDNAVIEYVVATPVRNPDNSWTVFVVTYLDGGEPGPIAGTINATLQLGDTAQSVTMYIEPTVDQKFEITVGTTINLSSDDVELWWPNGYGAQPLYNLTVAFVGDTEQDEKTVRVGFRTIEVVQEELVQGLSFYFKVNDHPIFAKGANEIPISVLPEKGQDPATVKFLLESAKEVHMNMLRVWGGGVYESDYFYDLADEYGIIIWQDFMFACSMYPSDDAFLSNVRNEVRHQLRRLGSHTSIAIWSGNNENEGALRDNWYNTSSNFEVYKQDYIKLYVDLIQSEVEQILPNVSFVTSSPSNGLETDKEDHVAEWPGNPLYGDIHFYDYTKDSWDLTTYLTPRFSSEYGYQSMPCLEAWNTATVDPTVDVRPDSDFLYNRQHHPDGNQQNLDLIDVQLQLPDPSSENYVEAFIYFSQIVQAQSIKIQTEHYRSFKGRLTEDGYGNTMGALYWQLNDVWVAPTWSGIDFTGRWKMLHYQAREFFNPMLITGRLVYDILEIYAILDDLVVPNFTVKSLMHIYKWDSLEPLVSIEFPVTLDPLKAVLVTTIDAQTALITAGCGSDYEEAKRNCFFHLHLLDEDNNHLVPFNHVFPQKLKIAALADANVAIESITATDEEGKEFDIVVTTDVVALFVWLDAHQIIGRFSANGFLHVLPSRTVHFTANEPTTVEELSEHLTVTHLRDPMYM